MGLHFTIVRPFNVYGPAPTSTMTLTAMVRRAVAGETIFVSGTGGQTRSWCHIQDFEEGLVRCLFDAAAPNETFNLGNNTNRDMDYRSDQNDCGNVAVIVVTLKSKETPVTTYCFGGQT